MKLSFLILALLFYMPCNANKNIVFIIGDDLKPALSSYGDVNAYTPNIDKLASESFIFRKAYAQVKYLLISYVCIIFNLL